LLPRFDLDWVAREGFPELPDISEWAWAGFATMSISR